MNKKFFILATMAILAIGCNPDKTNDPSPKEGTPPEKTSQPSATDTGRKPDATTIDTKAKEPESKPVVAALPDELKHDGYKYLGLGSTEPLTMTISGGPNGDQTGSQAFKLYKVEGGEAIYRVDTTGALQGLGNVEYTVRKDGVYARQIIDAGSKTKPQLQIPAKLTPGYQWNTKDEFSVQRKTVDVIQSNKVVGPQTITVGGKSYSTVLVTSIGTMKESGKTSKIETKMWLVKDRGQVKVEIVRTLPKLKPVKLTITTN